MNRRSHYASSAFVVCCRCTPGRPASPSIFRRQRTSVDDSECTEEKANEHTKPGKEQATDLYYPRAFDPSYDELGTMTTTTTTLQYTPVLMTTAWHGLREFFVETSRCHLGFVQAAFGYTDEETSSVA